MLHIFAQRYPFPSRRGDQLAVGKMVDFCRNNKIPYTLWVLPSRANKSALKKDNRKINVKFLKLSLAKFLIILLKRPLLPLQIRLFSGYKCPDNSFSHNDAVYIHTLRMDLVIENLPAEAYLGAQIDFSMEFRERANGVTWPFSLIYSLEASLLSIMSTGAFQKYKKVFRVTDNEFAGWDISNIVTNPHGFDANRIGAKPRKEAGKSRIGFFGNMTFMPNILAAQEFLRWRHLSQLDCEFVIFGRGSDKLEAANDVTFLGEVDDIDEAIASLDVVVNLVSVGGGFQNKTVEAWAQNVPVIGYEQAFRGLAHCSNLKIVIDEISDLDTRIDSLFKVQAKPVYSEWVEQNWNQEKNLEKRFAIMGLN
jgi:glycosyltransferase involved in cell wall biosynthesis